MQRLYDKKLAGFYVCSYHLYMKLFKKRERISDVIMPGEVASPYSLFAHCYDHMMRSIDYRAWAVSVDKVFSQFSVPNKRVLDIACGTGSFIIHLAALGYDCMGMDISQQMVVRSRENAKKHGVKIDFKQADMRSFDISGQIDAVVCLHDSINYITSSRDILKVFAAVEKVLVPGGIFIFDVSTRHNITENFAGHTFSENFEDYSYIWRNRFNRLTGKAVADLEFLIKKAGETRFGRERHVQQIYPLFYVRRLIKKSPFTLLSVYDGFTQKDISPGSEEVTFVVRKPLDKQSSR